MDRLDRPGRLRFLACTLWRFVPTVAVAGWVEYLRPTAGLELAATRRKIGLVTIVWGLTLAVGWHFCGWREAIAAKPGRKPMPTITLREFSRRCQKPDHDRIGNWMARRISRPLALRITWVLAPWGVSANTATLAAWVCAVSGRRGVRFWNPHGLDRRRHC